MARFAVAVLVLAFAASALAACSPTNTFYFGGATSVQSLENQVLNTYTTPYGCYASVGSGAGYTGFQSGTYAVAASDAAMTTTQEGALGFSKYTVPQGLQSYAMLYNGASALCLSCLSIAQLYSGAASSIGGGAITIPVVRGDKSGTTFIFTSYLNLCAGSTVWPTTKVLEQLQGPTANGCPSLPAGTPTWGSSKIICQTGSSGVGSYIFAHPGSIGYLGNPVAVTFVTGNIRIASTNNKAGNCYPSNTCSVAGAVPVSFPAAGATWSGVQTVFQAGSNTCPMASFVYLWARQTYPSTFVPSATATKAFLNFVFSSSGQALLPPLNFVPLTSASPALLTQDKNAVAAIM